MQEDVVYQGEAIIADPWQGFNRTMYRFNYRFDKYVFLPAVGAYQAVMPDFAEKGVHNFFTNFRQISTLINSILQLDGAHNVNATARQAWKVTPELFVQHAVNTGYSRAAGMPADLIALSTVPPTAPPAPKLRLDLPYAVALRDLADADGAPLEPSIAFAALRCPRPASPVKTRIRFILTPSLRATAAT